MQGLAWVSRELAGRPPAAGAGQLERLFSHDLVAGALALAAAGELAADKHPSTPDRIDLGPLLGRAGAGALVGRLAAGRRRPLLGALTGAGCAVAAAYLSWFLRREASRADLLPDLAVALAEDAVALSIAATLAGSLAGTLAGTQPPDSPPGGRRRTLGPFG